MRGAEWGAVGRGMGGNGNLKEDGHKQRQPCTDREISLLIRHICVHLLGTWGRTYRPHFTDKDLRFRGLNSCQCRPPSSGETGEQREGKEGQAWGEEGG